MAQVSDPYIREQLERRREELNLVLAASAPVAPAAPYLELLGEVDTAIQRLDQGTFGECAGCHGTVEKERLIADPLIKVCLDCLSADDRRALERDLELASSVQRGLLPDKDVRFGEWRIHYEYIPAGHVSGDYCDLIVPRGADGRLIFLMGDVAGKGLAASLLMTHLHAMFRSLSDSDAGKELELDRMIETANRVFCESTFAGQYATLICGSAGRTGELELASAGHLPALLVRRDGVKRIGATGLPLGLFSSSRYAVQRVRLEPGDSLLLFTDGISEANNSAGDEYGVKRLSNVAGERHRWNPQELLTECLKDLKAHTSGARQTDDQTLMVIHRSETAGVSLVD
ncbi:MAG TPA: SpoIIE family protein phosphatase [Candidatus Limnocylindria bacterium]|nr:SpoIIE family protein phosphatase [Candidatus Limnocylindria bacterium]